MGIIKMLKDVFQLLGSMKPEYESVLHVLDLAGGFVGCQQSASFWNSTQTFPDTINNGKPMDTTLVCSQKLELRRYVRAQRNNLGIHISKELQGIRDKTPRREKLYVPPKYSDYFQLYIKPRRTNFLQVPL
jgi:hypothetical protein